MCGHRLSGLSEQTVRRVELSKFRGIPTDGYNPPLVGDKNTASHAMDLIIGGHNTCLLGQSVSVVGFYKTLADDDIPLNTHTPTGSESGWTRHLETQPELHIQY